MDISFTDPQQQEDPTLLLQTFLANNPDPLDGQQIVTLEEGTLPLMEGAIFTTPLHIYVDGMFVPDDQQMLMDLPMDGEAIPYHASIEGAPFMPAPEGHPFALAAPTVVPFTLTMPATTMPSTNNKGNNKQRAPRGSLPVQQRRPIDLFRTRFEHNPYFKPLMPHIQRNKSASSKYPRKSVSAMKARCIELARGGDAEAQAVLRGCYPSLQVL
eukprot:TRINITY_DN30552_c0_g1_i1.p1 TRINITY_DN30552_c0_g1~~TRINITY_DN30552_c0_g1_i1.p1  ORF type:complete len:213 (+),score=41.92 TRINITY_DN30552_c0_g1_i1:142-780(+)